MVCMRVSTGSPIPSPRRSETSSTAIVHTVPHFTECISDSYCFLHYQLLLDVSFLVVLFDSSPSPSTFRSNRGRIDDFKLASLDTISKPHTVTSPSYIAFLDLVTECCCLPCSPMRRTFFLSSLLSLRVDAFSCNNVLQFVLHASFCCIFVFLSKNKSVLVLIVDSH